MKIFVLVPGMVTVFEICTKTGVVGIRNLFKCCHVVAQVFEICYEMMSRMKKLVQAAQNVHLSATIRPQNGCLEVRNIVFHGAKL